VWALARKSPRLEKSSRSKNSSSSRRWTVSTLNDGKLQPLGLRPVARDVVEIFGIGADLLKQSPAGLDVREVLFALVFAAALLDQAVDVPDAFERVMPDGQIEFADEAASAESGQGFSERDELSLDGWRRLVRLVVSRPRVLGQARRSLLLEAA
jgi:hypothetical protein